MKNNKKWTSWHYNTFYGDYEIGEGCKIGSYCDIAGKIGKNCLVQSYVFVPKGVTIGDNCFIGPGVMFANVKRPPLKDGEKIQKTVVHGGAVIGMRAVILPGITIGEAAIIGAGAVVTRSVPAREVWAGNPAKKIGVNCPLGHEQCMSCGYCPGI